MTPAPSQFGLFSADQAVVIRRSGRAKRLAVRVFPHGVVEVVAPLRAGPRSIEAFLRTHAGWIARARDQFRATQGHASLAPPSVIQLAAVGETWTVRYEPGQPRLTVLAGDTGGTLLLRGAADPDRQRKRLRRWLVSRARAALGPWLAGLAADTGLAYQHMTVRRQRSRWGSCSAAKVISLNCAALFLESALVRYLLLHELAHTRHMHHGHAFWRLVASLEPGYEDLESRLRGAWQAVPAWVSYDPPPA